MVRIARAEADRNHRKVVRAAARRFRERGFDGIAVSDLMKAAGFTHGGFYNHFASKEALAAEALEAAFREMDDERARVPDLQELLRRYLSQAARQAPGRSCPAAALAGDAARQPEAVKQTFAAGLERMIASLAERLPPSAARRGAAIALLARMVGALALARAVPASHPLGAEVLAEALQACLHDVRRLEASARRKR
jgi:TetR/AcrR family transcriptional repressor of nem operon